MSTFFNSVTTNAQGSQSNTNQLCCMCNLDQEAYLTWCAKRHSVSYPAMCTFTHSIAARWLVQACLCSCVTQLQTSWLQWSNAVMLPAGWASRRDSSFVVCQAAQQLDCRRAVHDNHNTASESCLRSIRTVTTTMYGSSAGAQHQYRFSQP